jgi:ubiquinone/menaquinone biosynthesis C-methylase UbiE
VYDAMEAVPYFYPISWSNVNTLSASLLSTVKTRGEKRYGNMPAFAARLYDNLTRVKGVDRSFSEIADFISTQLTEGTLLDAGTGPGRLLAEIIRKNPGLDLFGLDISESMLAVARKNIRSVKKIDLQAGNITKTNFPDNFFDCIVSMGSFYNWDKPVEALNEINRILKSGRTAYIFDTHTDYDKKLLKLRLAENLRDYSFLRKRISIFFLRKQLSMTYSLSDYDAIVKQSNFHKSFSMQEIVLGNLPVYIRLGLRKE